MKTPLRLCTVVLLIFAVNGVQKIDNELAPTEVFLTPAAAHDPPERCEISGPELDLLFVLDSSDSLREQFENEINAIKKVLNYVVVSPETTRVGLIQFTGNARTEFHFNTFSSRAAILQALDTLRPMSGITKIGNAFAHARNVLIEANGMRGDWVPKIVFLLSDGRSHDYPADWMNANMLRREVPNLNIWAYGTGEHIALNALVNYTLDSSKIAREDTIEIDVDRIFSEYKGKEICFKPPPCHPGSDKPMDLLFVFDSSTSLGPAKFQDQIKFMKRILHHVRINNKAVKVAMIDYKGTAKLEFGFNTFLNKTKLLNFLDTLFPTKGTTDTRRALKLAIEIFRDPERERIYGMRPDNVKKVVISLTDGFSRYRHASESSAILAMPNTTVYAIAVSPRAEVQWNSLLVMTGQREENVFNGLDLHKFEEYFTNEYVGFGCEGLEGPFLESTRGAINSECDEYGVYLSVRTRTEFFGKLYVQDHYTDPSCVISGDLSTEVYLDVYRGRCGIRGVPTFNEATGEAGVEYNFRIAIQFHQQVSTSIDESRAISCFYPDSTIQPQAGIPEKPEEIKCDYSLRRYTPDNCMALEAEVGEPIFHRWECVLDYKVIPYGILVHDCTAESDELSLPLLDSNGCEVDGYMLETPQYQKIQPGRRMAPVILPKAVQAMSTFKFPQSGSIQFRCHISLCDLDAYGRCREEINNIANGRCPKKDGRYTNQISRTKRQSGFIPTRPGYVLTKEVVTRRINVLENAAMTAGRVDMPKYCTQYH